MRRPNPIRVDDRLPPVVRGGIVAAWLAVVSASNCTQYDTDKADVETARAVFVVDTGAAPGAGARYASLEAALDAARERRRKEPSVPIRIEIGAGDHYLDAPLHIGPELSGTARAPTEITAVAGTSPRLLAGRRLELHWTPYRDGIYQAAVSGPVFDRLFVDGRPQVRARYPNLDPAATVLGGYAADALAPSRTARWRNPAGGVLHALHEGRWGGMHVPILGRDADGHLKLGAAVGNNRPSQPHQTYRYVENIFEELDAPGEWYLDGGKPGGAILYYQPPSGIDLSRVEVEAGA